MGLEGKNGLFVTRKSRRTWTVATACLRLAVLSGFWGRFGPKKAILGHKMRSFGRAPPDLAPPPPVPQQLITSHKTPAQPCSLLGTLQQPHLTLASVSQNTGTSTSTSSTLCNLPKLCHTKIPQLPPTTHKSPADPQKRSIALHKAQQRISNVYSHTTSFLTPTGPHFTHISHARKANLGLGTSHIKISHKQIRCTWTKHLKQWIALQ